jgi:hypothetical protein
MLHRAMQHRLMKKLYCYVDETGQDTEGRIFIVGMVIADESRDQLVESCELIEQETVRLSAWKWSRTADAPKLAYMRRVMDMIEQGRRHYAALCFVIYHNTTDYLSVTADAIERAVRSQPLGEGEAYNVTVLFDALPRTKEQELGAMLHKRKLKIRKVRGVRRDEADALIRLADAVCGLARDAQEGRRAARALCDRGSRRGTLREV